MFSNNAILKEVIQEKHNMLINIKVNLALIELDNLFIYISPPYNLSHEWLLF